MGNRHPLPPENYAVGFCRRFSASRGVPETNVAWFKANGAILSAAPETTPEGVRFFLQSPFGEKVAQAVLDGQSVSAQMEFRLARFRKHYAQTEASRTKENPR